MRLIEQVVNLLAEKRATMHVNEIANELVKKYPHIQIPAEDLPDKIGRLLASDLKRNKGKSIFSKPKNKTGGKRRGFYRLKVQNKSVPAVTILPDPPIVSTPYTGKAGEFAVLSELLFSGFNASLMAVDHGIDIVASKDNKYFHIQVKTANLSANGKYAFTLQQSSFESADASSTFYILVMRSRFSNDFLILPNSEIRRLIESGILTRAERMSIRVEKDKNGYFILNGKERLSWALNRFDIIV